MHDTLNRFMFDNTNVRGRHVALDATWKAALENTDYPAPVREVLGELMAASVLLIGTLKFRGTLKVEARGDGPLSLVVVQASSEKTVRGLARWQGPVPADGGLEERMGESGYLVLTLEPADEGQMYQGIVGLEGGSVAAALEEYFVRSEQLPTRIWLATDDGQAGGLLLQRMPDQAEQDPDAWDRTVHLASTLTDRELLGLPTNDLLYRLFHEEEVRVFDPEYVNFRCGCSREKVAGMLRGLGRREVQETLEQEGEVRVNCDFCGKAYVFDAVDAEQLFANMPPSEGSDSQH
ncbi:Hsp33 family molecular chaperone HslO [Thiohalorhabdus methylotrophus]|uniref:33 kDa chaperonin n=1 Tax=Thiohalorhabdus methylotrophus TaxID=3242694 RepID=A0ABV4TQ55_9GAMM